MRRAASTASAALELATSLASSRGFHSKALGARQCAQLGAGPAGAAAGRAASCLRQGATPPASSSLPSDQRRRIAGFGSVEISEARLHQLLEAEITSIAMREAQPMTLRSILKMGADVKTLASVLHEELPVRFAQRILMLESLPDWHKRPQVTDVRQMYVQSFKELRMADPSESDAFAARLHNIKKRHAHTNLLVGGFKEYVHSGEMSEAQINEWLDRFFKLRISTHMLMSQYLTFARQEMFASTRAEYVGGLNPYQSSINEKCQPQTIAQLAAPIVERMCANQYGISPDIEILDVGAQPFPFVPRYLFYIVSELMKNAVRATVEAHMEAESLPPVKVIVSGDENVACIRISDEGGGIPVKDLNHVWSYLYSTAPYVDTPVTRASVDNPTDVRMLDALQAGTSIGCSANDPDETLLARSPLAGLGCGLPLSRLYATYLGGTIELQTLPNYGTDVFAYLNRLGDREDLEECSMNSSRNSAKPASSASSL